MIIFTQTQTVFSFMEFPFVQGTQKINKLLTGVGQTLELDGELETRMSGLKADPGVSRPVNNKREPHWTAKRRAANQVFKECFYIEHGFVKHEVPALFARQKHGRFAFVFFLSVCVVLGSNMRLKRDGQLLYK